MKCSYSHVYKDGRNTPTRNTTTMRVRTLSSLALGRVPSDRWNALDEQVQNCLFPAELRRAVGRFQRFVLARRSEMRAFFSRALGDQKRACVELASNRAVLGMTRQYMNITLHSWWTARGEHLVVMRDGCTHHGISFGKDEHGGMRVAHVACDGRLRIVDLDTFLGAENAFGVVTYLDKSDEPVLRDRTVELAIRLAEMHPDDLRAYDLLRWNRQCFAWVCKTGALIGVDSKDVQSVLDVIDRDLRIIRYWSTESSLNHVGVT
jgi:hypothetical protein